MPPYCRGSKHQKNGLAPLEERKRLCDPPNLPNLISFICLFPINMQPLALFLRKEPGGLSSISAGSQPAFFISDSWRRRTVRGVMQTSRSIPLSGSLAIGSVVAQSVPAGVKVADGHREPASRLFAEDHFDRRPKRGGIGGL